MKKFSLVVVLALIGLVGCGGEGISEVSNDRPEANLDNFTVIEGPPLHEALRRRETPEVMPLEEAALLGAQYILDVFEEDLMGRYMHMFIRDHYPNLRDGLGGVEWCGDISPSNDHFDAQLFSFCLDAFTGERTQINNSFDRIDSFWPPLYQMVQMSEEERLEVFPEPTEEELSLMLEMATIYAQRHFGDSMQAIVIAEEFLDPYIPAGVITFYARNDSDRIIQLGIQRETFELISIFFIRPDNEWVDIPSF